jgi:hypothetical protein
MRTDFLIMADKAEAINGKLYMIGGGFDQVAAPGLPGMAAFDIAFGFLVDYHETNEPHEFSLQLKDADDNVVLPPLAGRIEVGRPAGMDPGQEQRVIVVFRGPFPLQAVGNFKWVPTLDGEEGPATRFRVSVAPAAGPQRRARRAGA